LKFNTARQQIPQYSLLIKSNRFHQNNYFENQNKKMFFVKLLVLIVFIVTCCSQNVLICSTIAREKLCVTFHRKDLKNCKKQMNFVVKTDQVSKTFLLSL